jgi:hypothetical protein
VGSGKLITVIYSFSGAGSREGCYEAPEKYFLSGAIEAAGRNSDAWGVVLKREEGSEVAAPFPGVRVAYAINGRPIGAVLTDSCGRYIIHNLGEGDVLTLTPEAKPSYMAPPEIQGVSVAGSFAQVADTILYLPDTVSLRGLTLSDGRNAPKVWVRDSLADTLLYYTLPCGHADTVTISYLTPPGVTGQLDNPDSGTTQAGGLILVNVSKPGQKIVPITLSSGKRYTVVIGVRHRLFELITEHLGNLRIVINNPAHNGGLTFTSCEWWRKMSGGYESAIAWEVVERTKLYYSAGPRATDRFSPGDSMYIVLTDSTGRATPTCPGSSVVSAASEGGGGGGDEASARLRGKVDDSAYPNPVMAGGQLHLKGAVLFDEFGDRYATFRLYSSQGQLALSGSAAAFAAGLTMPDAPGTYYLILDGRAGRRAIHIAVVK